MYFDFKFDSMLVFILHIFMLFITNIVYLLLLLIAVAYFTLLERKLMGSIQRRTGPKITGFYGILQPIADGIKLLTKEIIVPQKVNVFLYVLAPFLALFLSFVGWSVIPFSANKIMINLDLGVLYLVMISSLNVYGLIISGWSSNSKYAFLGALRATAQIISYELTMGFVILIIVLFVGSFNLTAVVLMQQKTMWFIGPGLPLFILFFVCMLAETNRVPFDLAEAEAELVAGYNVEYSSFIFAMFFLAEYANMLLMSGFVVILFFGGWLSPVSCFESGAVWFCLKIAIFSILFVVIRATLPRYRYDQLMSLGWKFLLPISFGLFIFYLGFFLLLFMS